MVLFCPHASACRSIVVTYCYPGSAGLGFAFSRLHVSSKFQPWLPVPFCSAFVALLHIWAVSMFAALWILLAHCPWYCTLMAHLCCRMMH